VKRGNFYLGNAYDKKEFRGDYNVVIATEVLEHVDDLKVLANIKSGATFIGSVPNFGDAAHLRTYVDKQKDIVDRFSKYLTIEKILFSSELGIYVIKALRRF
jgi:2-polyprenyl-3-methyl-5-hydroxy-6-metoxy-1,4-benzoquinol methylase